MDPVGCVIVALLASCAFAGESVPRPETVLVDHSELDAVLEAVVRGEGVDYPLLRETHLAALDAYLGKMASIDVSRLTPAERLALYINVYNATVLREVAIRFEPGFSVAEESFAFFQRPVVRLRGGGVSLNHLEHDIIRKEFDEPRVHAALVCAARSCPPLSTRAYRGDDLETVLESKMLQFINDGRRNRVDVSTRTLVLSPIFDWYAEDFGGRDRLASYVDQYLEPAVSGFAVRYGDYSWELNMAAVDAAVRSDRSRSP